MPEGYTLTGSTKADTVTTLTNSHTPELTEATVTKVWNDANNQDGKRPAEVTVSLRNTNVIATLSASNGWTVTASGLPKYRNHGEEIEYAWTEREVGDDYLLTDTKVEETVTTLTNSRTTETTEATVIKVWTDNEDQDGLRPESLNITLSNGMIAELTEDNEWTQTITGLPKYAEGQEIIYTWTEAEVPEGYVITSIDTVGTVTLITNTHEPELTEATVTKIWEDADNADGLRPAALAATLSNGDSVILNPANGWTKTVDKLPKYKNGEEIEYTWVESSVPDGYELTGNVTTGTVTTLTNSHTPADTETVEATVTKRWEDSNDQDGLRPDSIQVRLSNGTVVTLAEGNGWTQTVRNLPKYSGENEIIYTWTELDSPRGYTLSGSSTSGTVTTLTNSHTPETRELTVRKVWIDDDPSARPDSLQVVLSGGGASQVVTLSAGNGWEQTVTVPRYENGEEIRYTWIEGAVMGYTQTGHSVSGDVTTFTNTRNAVDDTEYTLTIYYRYITGGTAAETYFREHLKPGTSFYVPSPDIANHLVNHSLISGVMPARNLVYVVLYAPMIDPENPEGEILITKFLDIDEYNTALGLGTVVKTAEGDALE